MNMNKTCIFQTDNTHKPVDELLQAQSPLLNERLLKEPFVWTEWQLSLQGFARQSWYYNLRAWVVDTSVVKIKQDTAESQGQSEELSTITATHSPCCLSPAHSLTTQSHCIFVSHTNPSVWKWEGSSGAEQTKQDVLIKSSFNLFHISAASRQMWKGSWFMTQPWKHLGKAEVSSRLQRQSVLLLLLHTFWRKKKKEDIYVPVKPEA